MRRLNYSQQHRRYQLHRHLKKFSRLSVNERRIYISEQEFNALPPRKQNYIKEIRDKYGYAIQIELPP